MKTFGQYYCWYEGKKHDGEKLEPDRFNQFIREMRPPVPLGDVHAHAFYSQKNGEVYWKLVGQKSSVCNIKGRCKRITVTASEPVCKCNHLQSDHTDDFSVELAGHCKFDFCTGFALQ